MCTKAPLSVALRLCGAPWSWSPATCSLFGQLGCRVACFCYGLSPTLWFSSGLLLLGFSLWIALVSAGHFVTAVAVLAKVRYQFISLSLVGFFCFCAFHARVRCDPSFVASRMLHVAHDTLVLALSISVVQVGVMAMCTLRCIWPWPSL